MKNTEKLTTEIKALKRELAENVIKFGKASLGEDATLNQIFNYAAPQFGLEPEDFRELIFHVSGEPNG